MANLLSVDQGTEKVYKHSGITSTILDSFSTVFNSSYNDVRGITWDGTRLIGADYGDNKIYVHSGFTSTITNSFASPGDKPYGLAFESPNLLSCDWDVNLIYRHSGVSSTILSTFATAASNVSGLAFDGVNALECDWGSDKVYKHSGLTATILDSFSLPGGTPLGVAWDGTNLISSDYGTDQIYLHSGFSSTITDSFNAPAGAPSGLDYYVAANQPPTAPTSLLCEGQASPVSNVTDLTPEFSAIFNDPDSGDIANAFEIEVGTSPGGSDMWDSGWIDISGESLVEGNRCNDQSYAGSALSLDGSTYYWRCRFRDDDNAEGVWSTNAQFTMQSAAPPPTPVTRQGLLSQIW